MRYKDLDSFIAALEVKILKDVPGVIAKTATEYFKERFSTKEWDGTTWVQTRRVVRRGSLLVRTSELVNSIRPSLVTQDLVRISAGNDKVSYAKIHNEGGTLHPKVTPAMRRWAWAKYYEAGGGKEKGKKTAETGEASFYKRLALTKKTQLDIVIPPRKFMGHSDRLNSMIHDRIVRIINE